jgi:hypothetical protein
MKIGGIGMLLDVETRIWRGGKFNIPRPGTACLDWVEREWMGCYIRDCEVGGVCNS